jgi:hypothetical protein
MTFWVFLNLFLQLMFLTDIFVQCFSVVPSTRKKEAIIDRKLILINYCKTWMLIDIISIVPYDLIFHELLYMSDEFNLGNAAKLLRLARFVRVFKMIRVIKLL